MPRPQRLYLLMRLVAESRDECVLWPGAKTDRGYGQLRHHYRVLYVHRLAWEMVYGPIPPGHDVDHDCEVKLCVNPSHLFPVDKDHHAWLSQARRTLAMPT